MLTPEERIKELSSFSSKIDLNPNIAAKKYYRSGQEMIRMADVYLKEKNLEQAYILYMKFMILFLETIPEHPDFKNVPIDDRNLINQLLREVLPKAENLKNKLRTQYSKEYELFMQHKELQSIKANQEKEALENKKNAFENNILPISTKKIISEQCLNFTSENIKPPTFFDTTLKNEPSRQSNLLLELNAKPNEIPSSSGYMYSPINISENKPVVDRSTKPSLIKSTYNLRTVIVPGNLIERFLEHANSNTMKNLETCGILAGKLSSNSLNITHLMIPKQSGTSDSCTTMNEEDIFEFQDKNDLITLGWIHTHPSQTSFMSSVDLHTHYSYQLMMPEALAIVCAPKYNKNNFFFLTPYHGLQVIANCKNVEGFHTHNTDGDIYAIAEHYTLNNSLHVNVVDFR
ncbi:STAM-binding protein [Daktulosphaira vitifoliae]|uniref:STAM-binding protein n=1 Tax=Daktulosphaira vitifoliae TaxID=58002 RepID=UPI0021A9ACBD|nr:STAM-binding protein [Daktulosphaira vitifoliae]